ncbi:helix-turn-helix domain-containing protein [Leptospira gomenensis]|uniref:Helix-turn-helix domain-containing protein n=2 Tax=Leptospira gomenensis TaxID=2484974 RepID=A0A5F1YD90_9LEPT|nr:7TM diverse intracellular signaling domain-containing protein [Leptospira gomenensis]TGK36033.1 helix-turn-helix domain-containing protein [Leptospira gomenensis]TGK43954.1 helix-turn-helix domain-containing protein [Leptospira gomenensis]TGK53364.1 helix-turn-helix domain-containing protein [Leptospira gomenensis]
MPLRLSKHKTLIRNHLLFFFLVILSYFPISAEASPNEEKCRFERIDIAVASDSNDEIPNGPDENLAYTQAETSLLKFGFIPNEIWIRFSVTDYPRSRCFLRIPQVTLDAAVLFSKTSIQISGDRFPYSERTIDDYYPTFHLEPSETKDGKHLYYLWIKTSSIVNFPLLLESGLEYQRGNYFRNLLILFVLVLSLFITLLTGFVYRQTLDPIYLSIVGFSIFISLEGWACFANGYKYLWPYAPEFQNITPPLFAFLALACSAYFVYQFLSPGSPSKFVRFSLVGSATALTAYGILSAFFANRPFVVLSFSWSFVIVVALILISILSVIGSFAPAKKIVFCVIPIAGSVLITTLYYLDLIKYNEYSLHAYVISLPAIYVVVMISLSDREKFVRRKTISRAYDIQQLQEKLEKPVGTPKAPSIQFSLDHLFKVERIFKNPDLTKEDLTSILKISSEELEEYIQKTENTSSFDIYISRFRVEEAKHLLKTRNNLKSSEIAQRAGFGSAREMEKSFKSLIGMTSSEYKLMVRPESI